MFTSWEGNSCGSIHGVSFLLPSSSKHRRFPNLCLIKSLEIRLGCYYILPIKVFSSEISSWLELLCVFQFETRLPPLHLCFCCQESFESSCAASQVCGCTGPKVPSQTVNQCNNQPEATHSGLYIFQNIRKERCHLKKIFQSFDIWLRGHLIPTEQLLIFWW